MGLGLSRGLRHGLLIGLDVFTINKIDSVGVDNSTVIVLALDFKVVSNQVDGTARVHRMLRFERRVAKVATTATPAVTLVTSATWAAATTTLIVGPSTLGTAIGAVLVAAIILLAATATSMLPLLVAPLVLALIAATTAVIVTGSSSTHVVLLLLLLLPRLALAHVRIVASLVVVVLVAPAHMVLRGALPVLLAILIVSTAIRWLIVVLHS